MTDLSTFNDSDDFILGRDEVKALINGNFNQRICSFCNGTGWVHFDSDGVIIGVGYKHDWSSDNPKNWITSEGCEECLGFGQIIKFEV